MILQENYTMNNGLEIPKLGLGTWMIDNDTVVQAVKDALDVGYRHIDTAQAYGNEVGVGAGLRGSGVSRSDIFLTTKVDAGAKTHQEAAASIDGSLAALGVDYIDLMIIHSPQPWSDFGGDNRYYGENREVWRALEEAYQAGKLKAIGLSNFQRADVDNILESATVRPMVNQILAHISSTPHELIAHSQDEGMLVEAYSPVAHGELLKNDEVAELAYQYEVSVPQLSIRYCLQLGMLPLPKTANPEHMRNNADVDFEISEQDMEKLKNVEEIKDYGDASVMPVFAKP